LAFGASTRLAFLADVVIATIVVFAVATIAVAVVGPRLARVAEAVANRLDVGHVLVGAVLLGVVTSLPGLVLTVTAASRGETELAVANALGGVAAQTLFLAIADIAFRSGTLSSHVPTRQVGYQAALLMVLLALVVIGLGTADVAVAGMHPMSVCLIGAYLGGMLLARRLDVSVSAIGPEPDPSDFEGGRAGQRGKLGTLEESPKLRREEQRSWGALWARFGVFAALLSLAGFALAWAGGEIATSTALSATSVGVLLTAVATSTPELVTAVAAARRGAIGLAAGDIIGGNTFDTLFIAAADIVSPGSVFAGAGPSAVGLAGLVILLNGVLLAGLVRQGSGTVKTDTESLTIVVIWLISAVVLLT
jgi:cation:H+ antiporter